MIVAKIDMAVWFGKVYENCDHLYYYCIIPNVIYSRPERVRLRCFAEEVSQPLETYTGNRSYGSLSLVQQLFPSAFSYYINLGSLQPESYCLSKPWAFYVNSACSYYLTRF